MYDIKYNKSNMQKSINKSYKIIKITIIVKVKIP
jgi:hypothetical protein